MHRVVVLADLRVESVVFAVFVSLFLYGYRGKVLCLLRDLVPLFSVIVSAVQELRNESLLVTCKREHWVKRREDTCVKELRFCLLVGLCYSRFLP